MSISGNEYLWLLELAGRPAGRNIIGYVVDAIRKLRSERAAAIVAMDDALARLAQIGELAHDTDDDTHEARSARLGECARIAFIPRKKA